MRLCIGQFMALVILLARLGDVTLSVAFLVRAWAGTSISRVVRRSDPACGRSPPLEISGVCTKSNPANL